MQFKNQKKFSDLTFAVVMLFFAITSILVVNAIGKKQDNRSQAVVGADCSATLTIEDDYGGDPVQTYIPNDASCGKDEYCDQNTLKCVSTNCRSSTGYSYKNGQKVCYSGSINQVWTCNKGKWITKDCPFGCLLGMGECATKPCTSGYMMCVSSGRSSAICKGGKWDYVEVCKLTEQCQEESDTYAHCVPKTVAVSSVTISGGGTVKVGETLRLLATVLPTNATNKTVTWSSSNTSVAKVNISGVVTGLKAGTVVIKAIAGGKTATKTITVSAVKVNGVCGSKNGGIIDHAPNGTEACQVGSISFTDKTASDGTYNWTCAGSNGGLNATCSATKSVVPTKVNGVCGSKNGGIIDHAPNGTEACQVGSISFTDKAASDGTYNWTCAGSSGGLSATCSATKSVACTDYNYGITWSECRNDIMTRNYNGYLPANCTGIPTKPVETKECCSALYDYRCNDNKLEYCNGSGWVLQEDCGTNKTCNATSRLCVVKTNTLRYSLTVEPTVMTLGVNKYAVVKPTLTPKRSSEVLKWKSSDESIAKVYIPACSDTYINKCNKSSYYLERSVKMCTECIGIRQAKVVGLKKGTAIITLTASPSNTKATIKVTVR